MVDLPKVSQTFESEAQPYVDGIMEMLAANEDLINSIRDVQSAIDELHGKTVDIDLNVDEVARQCVEIDEMIDALPDEKIIRVTTVYGSTGSTGDSGSVSDLTDALDETAQAWSRVGEAGDENAARLMESMRELIGTADEVGGTLDRVFSVSSDGAVQMQSAAEAVGIFDDGLRKMSGDSEAAAISMLGLGEDTGRAAKAVDTVGGAFVRSVAGFTLFGLGWSQLHWIMMGSIEAIATILPALIALGAGMAAGAEGATWIADKMEGVYTATEATSQMLGQTAGNALGLKSVLQQAQTAADPGVYELLGGALEGARTQFFNFGAEGVSVIHMLDTFIAKIDVELAGAVGGQLHQLLGSGVSDLQAWGSVLGNIGHMILNLASAMPGLAEVLVHALAAFTGLLNTISNLSPQLITFAMGLEETWRWGGKVASLVGVLASGLGSLAGKVGEAAGSLALMGDTSKLTGIRAGLLGVEDGGAAAAGGLESVAGVLAGPWGWAIAGAALGLGLIIDKMYTAQSAAQQWASSMETAIGKAAPAQGLTDILTDLPKLQQAYQGVAQAAAAGTGPLAAAAGRYGNIADKTEQAAAASKTYQSASATMISQAVDLLTMNTRIGGTWYSLNTAMGLAGAAGLTVGQMFQKNGQLTAVAAQQILDLVDGYKEMDQTGTTLSNDINAINEQALIQQTRVQALNQAWDGFITQMTGVTSATATLYTDLSTIGNVTLSGATSKISAFMKQTTDGASGTTLSVKGVAEALKTFNSASAQVWSNWDSSLNQAEQSADSFRTAAAAGGLTNAQYTESIKGIVAQMLPYASQSQTATNMLEAIAQQAGGPASGSFQTLSKWVGNTTTATSNLNKITQTATQYMSNLGNVAANLASTMNAAVDQAVTNGAVNIKGITTASQNFTTSVQKAGGQLTATTTGPLKGFVTQLYIAGQPLATTKSVIDQILTRMGDSPSEIAKFNKAITTFYSQAEAAAKAAESQIATLQQEIDGLHGKTITITSQYVTSGNMLPGVTTGVPAGVAGPGVSVPGLARAASGMLVPGHGSGDTVPAMLTPGEAVVPKHLVSAIAPFLGATRVPGVASGGMVAPMAAPAPDLTGMLALQTQLSGLTSGVTADTALVSKDAASVTAAQAAVAAAQKTLADKALTEDRQKYDVAASAAAAMAKLLKSAEKADTAAWTHVKAVEAMRKGPARDLALDDAYKAYDARAEAVTKDKASLKTMDAAAALADRALSKAENTERQAAFTLWQKQRSEHNAQTALALAQLGDRSTQAQMAQLQKIQAGTAGLPSMNDLLLPGTPLASIASAMPGVGLYWGSYDQGGFLPPGLSLAVNGTGAPEPVGAMAGGGEIHSHINVHLDGQQIWGAVQKETLRYDIRNRGYSTGSMKPGSR